MRSRVVHCKREPFDVYIGRGRDSRWGNPFSHREGTSAEFVVGSRAEAVEAYRRWLWTKIQAPGGTALIAELAELHGKTLGCWCAPQACHGDVLAAAAEWAHDIASQAS